MDLIDLAAPGPERSVVRRVCAVEKIRQGCDRSSEVALLHGCLCRRQRLASKAGPSDTHSQTEERHRSQSVPASGRLRTGVWPFESKCQHVIAVPCNLMMLLLEVGKYLKRVRALRWSGSRRSASFRCSTACSHKCHDDGTKQRNRVTGTAQGGDGYDPGQRSPLEHMHTRRSSLKTVTSKSTEEAEMQQESDRRRTWAQSPDRKSASPLTATASTFVWSLRITCPPRTPLSPS
eukprot:3662804-Rhodomonas_salina.8